MIRLVTLEEVKRNLGYDTTAEDVRLEELIDDASEAILNYLEVEWSRVTQYADDASDEDIAAYERAFGTWTDSNGLVLTDSTGVYPATDSNGSSLIPGAIRRATHLMIGALDKDREGETDGFTMAVVSLLKRYRMPTLR